MDSSLKKINVDNINSDISGFYKKFSTDYLDEEITVVNKDIIGRDGEVVKYIDTNNKVSRCTVIIYGEDEKSTSEYYFIDGYIYVTTLKEYYTYPIYYSYNRPIDIMYRTFDEAVIYDGMIYELVNGEFIKKNIEDIKMPYTSLQEINEAIGEWDEKSINTFIISMSVYLTYNKYITIMDVVLKTTLNGVEKYDI